MHDGTEQTDPAVMLDLAGLSTEQAAGMRTVARAMHAGLLDDFRDLFDADPYGLPAVAQERLAAVS